MKKISMLAVILVVLTIFTGCCNISKNLTQSASSKNLDIAGFVLFGDVETANSETYCPQGRLITGHLNYKSRKVGIPADQIVPNTGNFRHTKTISLFGVEEEVIEYDYTAGSEEDAANARRFFEEKRKEAEQRMNASREKQPE